MCIRDDLRDFFCYYMHKEIIGYNLWKNKSEKGAQTYVDSHFDDNAPNHHCSLCNFLFEFDSCLLHFPK